MRLLKLSALALAVESAYGYLDTSPFFMFSTSEYELQSLLAALSLIKVQTPQRRHQDFHCLCHHIRNITDSLSLPLRLLHPRLPARRHRR